MITQPPSLKGEMSKFLIKQKKSEVAILLLAACIFLLFVRFYKLSLQVAETRAWTCEFEQRQSARRQKMMCGTVEGKASCGEEDVICDVEWHVASRVMAPSWQHPLVSPTSCWTSRACSKDVKLGWQRKMMGFVTVLFFIQPHCISFWVKT